MATNETSIAAQAQDIVEWRCELATAIISLRKEHPDLNKAQLLDLAAILCDWSSYARFRNHCPSPVDQLLRQTI